MEGKKQNLLLWLMNFVIVTCIIGSYIFLFRKLSVNVGLRIVRSSLMIGVPITALIAVYVGYRMRLEMHASDRMLILAGLLALCFYVIIPLRAIVRKRRNLASFFVNFLLYSAIVGIGYQFWEDRNLADELVALKHYPQTAILICKGFGAGFLLCYGLPFLTLFIERIKENGKIIAWYRNGYTNRWAGPGTYSKYPKRLQAGRTTKSVHLGRTRFEDYALERDVFQKDDCHLLTVGACGSGKSITAIWPFLATYSGSALVMDPKGEHADTFCRRRTQINEKVFVLDPFGATTSEEAKRAKARYNPLAEIDLTQPEGRKRLSAVSSSMIHKTNGKNRYWEEGATILLEGIIAFTLATKPKECHNLPAVADLILGRGTETNRADPTKMDELKLGMLMCSNELVQTAAIFLSSLDTREYGLFMTELLNSLKWTTDPAIREQISHSDFLFSEFQSQNMTVFVSVPFGAMVEHDRWLRILTNLSMRIFEDAKQKISPALVVILDELHQYGKNLQQLQHDVVALRSVGVKLWPFVQNYKQLEECFGPSGVADFESSSTIQVFGIRDNQTAKWVEEKLGRTLHKSSEGPGQKSEKNVIPLMDAAKLQTTFQKNKPVEIVFPADGHPMFMERMAFKSLTMEGQRFRGLNLEGLYDLRP